MAHNPTTLVGAYSSAPYSSANFPAIAKEIEESAYLMLYENTLMPKLLKQVGQGQKGTAIHYPYFNPSTFAAAASGALVEGTDYETYTQLTNASVYLVASEFGIASFMSDTVGESASFDFKGEVSRQQGIGVATKLEKHCISRVMLTGTAGGFGSYVSGVTATGTTVGGPGLNYTKIAAAKTLLDSKLVTVPGEKYLVIPEYAYFWTAKGTYQTTYAAALPKLGDETLDKWHITTAFGDVHIMRNNHIAINGTSSVALGAMFVRDAAAIWTPRDYRMETERDASARGDEFVSTMRAGAKILATSFGVRVYCYAGAPS